MIGVEPTLSSVLPFKLHIHFLARLERFELSSIGLEPIILAVELKTYYGGARMTRTSEPVWEQIYSLLSLPLDYRTIGCVELDLHQRSLGYEPSEILLLHPAIFISRELPVLY